MPATLRAEPRLEQFFAQNCVKCHGPEEPKSEVRLDKPFAALIADDELLETITNLIESGEMPPEEKTLSESEIQLLRDWIEQGAVFLADATSLGVRQIVSGPGSSWRLNLRTKKKTFPITIFMGSNLCPLMKMKIFPRSVIKLRRRFASL